MSPVAGAVRGALAGPPWTAGSPRRCSVNPVDELAGGPAGALVVGLPAGLKPAQREAP